MLLISTLQTDSLRLSPIELPGTDSAIVPCVSLAELTSYRVGGAAEWYVAPRNWQALQATFEWFQKQDLPLTLLGAGSNLLVSDRGLPGLVLSTRHLRHCDFNTETAQVTVGAGEPIPRLAWQAAKRGWRGLEWAVGIPGTVGGAVVMNAGAHEHCLADCLVSATVVSPSGQVETLPQLQLPHLVTARRSPTGNRCYFPVAARVQPF